MNEYGAGASCVDDPELDLCDPPADLNNGIWHIADINYYRRSVTKGDTKKLVELMGMNETNETELPRAFVASQQL